MQKSRPGPFGIPEINYNAPPSGIKDRKILCKEHHYRFAKTKVMSNIVAAPWAKQHALDFVKHKAAEIDVLYPPKVFKDCKRLFEECVSAI
jgi:hypothetical protein